MTRKRIAAIAAAVLVLVVAALAAWLVFSLDRLVAAEIERAGTEATGTRVNVAGVHVTLKEASGTIRSLRIANPSGFSPGAVLDADTIRFDLDVTTLRKDVLIVDEVVIARPRLRFEVSKDGKANVDALAKKASGTDEAAPQKLRIKRFVIEGGGIEADASAMKGKSATVPLRDIVLTNVGGRDGGTSDEVAAEIVAAVRKEVLRAVAKEGFKRYLGGSEDEIKGKARDTIKGLFGK